MAAHFGQNEPPKQEEGLIVAGTENSDAGANVIPALLSTYSMVVERETEDSVVTNGGDEGSLTSVETASSFRSADDVKIALDGDEMNIEDEGENLQHL